MVKRTLLALFVLFGLLNGALQAQKLGFIAGLQLNYGNIISLDDYAKFQSIPNAGFHVGMMYEMDFTNRWGFDVAAMYEMRNMCWNMIYTEEGNETSNKFHRQIGYFNVPANLFVYLTNNDKGALSLFGGPVFTCGLHARDLAYENAELHKPVTFMDEDMFSKDNGGRIMRCEIALQLGFAYKWHNGFQVRASYQHSLNNGTLNKYLYTLPMEYKSPTYFTQGQFKMTFVYLFDLRK